MKNCFCCHKKIHDAAHFCPYCGKDQFESKAVDYRFIFIILFFTVIIGFLAVYNPHPEPKNNGTFISNVGEELSVGVWNLLLIAVLYFSLGKAISGRNRLNFIFLIFFIGILSTLFYMSWFESGRITFFIYNTFAVLFFNIGLNIQSEIGDKSGVIFEGLKQGFVAHFLTSFAGSVFGSLIAVFFTGVFPAPLNSHAAGITVFLISFFMGYFFSRMFGRLLGNVITPKVAAAMGGLVGGLVYGLSGLYFGYMIGFIMGFIVIALPFAFMDGSMTGFKLASLVIGPLGALIGFRMAVAKGIKSGSRMGEKGYGNGNGGFGGTALGGLRGSAGFGGGFSGGAGAGGLW